MPSAVSATWSADQIRCVGDPRERFTEDALRILRAVRFSAQLDFEIEAETKAALAEFAPRLTKVSAERIQVELMKLLTFGSPGGIPAWSGRRALRR